MGTTHDGGGVARRQIVPVRVEQRWTPCDPQGYGLEAIPVFKRVLTVLAIAFAAYYLITAPQSAANAVSGAGSAVGDGFEAIIVFFTSLF